MDAGEPDGCDLIRLETRAHQLICSQSRTVLIAGTDGWITDPSQHGLFIHETRLLSHYLWRVNGELYNVESSQVRQFSHFAYHIARPRRTLKAYSGVKDGLGDARNATEETIELAITTLISDGMFQAADLRNFTLQEQPIKLEIAFDADFADLTEMQTGRQVVRGRRTATVESDGGAWAVHWRFQASRRHRGRLLNVDRGAELRLRGLPTGARASRTGVSVEFMLAPRQTLHCELDLSGRIEGNIYRPLYRNYDFRGNATDRDERIRSYCASAACVRQRHPLRRLLEHAMERAVDDLIALRMFDLDRAPHAWVPAAGVPIYVATFGRDILSAAWMSALCSPALLAGSLQVLRELQGRRDDPWRDEEPGKMLHEAHTGPLPVLEYRPQGRYYGSFTTSPFYAIVLSEFYHWTGDRTAMEHYLPAAEAAIAWVERWGDLDHDGFYEYRTRSKQGVKNQAWKDSGDAIIYTDGSIVPNPIGTCEEQGYVYEALLRLTELYWVAGRRWEAVKTFRRSQELKKRFNERFWMEPERFFAMAKGPKGRLVRSIGSNPGDALATGIIDAKLAIPTVERLFKPELFSGWGIRTLSTEHVSFNPYSYHRGSVWPSENAAIAVGLRRYGFTERLQELAAGLLQVADMFAAYRLPEVFTGHSRDAQHPFPAVYPQANAPQAWSAAGIVLLLQMILGLYPYAPLHLLFATPALPEWLPELTLENVQVGEAAATLHFHRDEKGESHCEVVEQTGHLRLIKQDSPWSVFSSPLKRAEELIESFAA
ncbi:MAG: glycogen debranching N-terminal domain-containing protein [Terriglobales bacterium]